VTLRHILLALVLLLPLPAAAQQEAAAVRDSFLGYKSAILTGDGETAAELVTERTHALYRGFADSALTLDKPGLDALHVMDRMSVMQLRHQLNRRQLESMSGEEIVAYAVDHGWIGKDGAARLQVGDFTVDGDFATAPILGGDGKETLLRMRFAREGGVWRLDLVEMMALTRVAIAQAIRQTGMSEDAFILVFLEAASGRKPDPDIWSPPS